MSLTSLLVPTYRQTLRALAGLLDKAQQLMPERAESFMSARLAADMYPLSGQVRFAVYQAQVATFRLRGEPVPGWLAAMPSEGRTAGDAPGTIADAQTRIAEALSLLDGLTGDALDAGANRPIALEIPGGIAFDMTGEQYARDWALPQFYFHVVTAYAILRNQGVDIGKADYVAHMGTYRRSGPTSRS